ncbi:ABC transporter ATP-binding protein [bacterium]|nr:ABC transporter ATP-binding protein [bacterium]
MNNIISIRNVKKQYHLGKTIVEALRGINLGIEAGLYYSIIGPSGSGKSSLLNIIGCIDVPSEGKVVLQGRNIEGFTERELTRIRAEKIGFIFQNFNLNPILTAIENVAIAMRFIGKSKKICLQNARAALDQVGLSHRTNHYPNELSGGERQRVAIARAIVKKPSLILADEPTGNIDTKTGHEIIRLLRKINEKQNTTVIQVTHDLEIADLSDKLFKLRDGVIVD